ncbi:MAG: chemotaxis protein CheW, partial [Sphingomonadales bacterium]
DQSLFARIGGQAALEATVKIFYDRVLADATLKPFFEGVNMTLQRQMMGAFLGSGFGGDVKYTGRALAVAHAPLVADGLNDRHFDAFVGHLTETLTETGMAAELTDEVKAIVDGLREQVLCRAPGGAKLVRQAEARKKQATATKSVESPASAAAPTEPSLASQSIRVNVDVLEDLMNMVSELVLTRNQLDQMVRSLDDSEFTVPLQRLRQCTTELQESVMKTRMQPIGNAWAKLPRIVRDLCQELGKKIDLRMKGADTELDRQVLELIKDPLTHMVRNSGDHGIEPPSDRVAAGKPETGRIVLNAYHEGGHIMIEIRDDGRGLPVEKIRRKVIASGLATEAEVSTMSDQQIQKYIFQAGLSTAEKVTAVSGRGVGMDVVRSNIEKIGGTVDVTSVEGKGSTFTIKIPLTLAIVSALIVDCGGERFAIPQLSVLELVRASQESEHKIERINKTPVLRLRDRLLPLIFLKDVLGLNGDKEAAKEKSGDQNFEEAFVVVSQVGSFSFGIVVDRVFDTEEIVVKPVAPILRNISVYSGNTILGDGSVIMILDPNGIAATTDESLHHTGDVAEDTDQAAARADNMETLLTFRVATEAPRAVPLSLVARLEEIDVDAIETSDGKCIVQYRGRLMPVVKIDDSYDLKSEGRQPVLVFADGKRSMGLAVDEIIDIVDDRFDVELGSATSGIVGAAVIAGQATEIIDVPHYLSKAFPDWFTARDEQVEHEQSGRSRVLLIDDSSFFRNMLKPLLAVSGYDVTTVECADEALKLRDDGEAFDIIVSDIELPGMNGFEFAETVKSEGPWQSVPIVALSKHTSHKYFTRGREVGFDDYIEKFDRDTLLNALSETLAVRGDAA